MILLCPWSLFGIPKIIDLHWIVGNEYYFQQSLINIDIVIRQ